MITIMVNKKMVDFSQNIRIFHNGELTVDEKIKQNPETMEKTFLERKDYFYIFED